MRVRFSGQIMTWRAQNNISFSLCPPHNLWFVVILLVFRSTCTTVQYWKSSVGVEFVVSSLQQLSLLRETEDAAKSLLKFSTGMKQQRHATLRTALMVTSSTRHWAELRSGRRNLSEIAQLQSPGLLTELVDQDKSTAPKVSGELAGRGGGCGQVKSSCYSPNFIDWH